MFRRKLIPGCWLSAMLALTFSTPPLGAQSMPASGPSGGGGYIPAMVPQPQPPAGLPIYRVAERTAGVVPSASPELRPGDPNEHPLMPALRWARDGLINIEKIQDYSATVWKRERVGDKLGDYESMFVKVRHKPFSVYMYFLGPPAEKGQEVIFVDGANDGKMFAHAVGIRDTMFGTVSLKPDGIMAMRGQRYPLTQLGILNLTHRLIEVAEQDCKYGECDVKFFKGAKIDDRVCTCVQVTHPVPRRNFLFNVARIFVDEELNIPVCYAAYSWPKEPGGPPELLEEYTYRNVKLNNGYTDRDFDTHNTDYHFR